MHEFIDWMPFDVLLDHEEGEWRCCLRHVETGARYPLAADKRYKLMIAKLKAVAGYVDFAAQSLADDEADESEYPQT